MSGTSTDSAQAGVTASLGVAEWLGFAATPSFALMAVLTVGHHGSPTDTLCSAAHDGSMLGQMLGGMLPMYVLMSAFHSAPWLKLISSPQRDRAKTF